VRENHIKLFSISLSLLVNYLFFCSDYFLTFGDGYNLGSRGSLYVIYFVEFEESENEFQGAYRDTLMEHDADTESMAISASSNGIIQNREIRAVESEDFSPVHSPVVASGNESMQQQYPAADDLLRSLPSQNVEFATRLPWERHNPVREIPPERFRMKRSVTVEDVIRDVSRFLGLWPAGYTDDPCPDIQRKLNSFSGDPSANPDMVRELLMVRARYCN